jgi:hypothetical protein
MAIVQSDWKSTGLVLLIAGLGIYALYKKITTAIPETYEFSELNFTSVVPSTVGDHGSVVVNGGFRYAGKNTRHFRVIAEIAREPFDSIFKASGHRDITINETGWKDYSFSVPVTLNDYQSPVSSPFDIQIRLWDVDAGKTVKSIIVRSVLTVTSPVYTASWSVSPAGAGYYLTGGSGESGSGEWDSGVYSYITIDVVANPGWIFSHWETSGTLLKANTEKSNSIKNDGSSYTAVFVQESAQPVATFNVQPNYSDGWIYYGTAVGQGVLVAQYGANNDKRLLQNDTYYYFTAVKNPYSNNKSLDYWIVNGYNMGASNPIGLYITGPVDITAVMK